LPVPPAVETVEKVPFQKLTFEKWRKNIEERLVFCVPNNILAIFEPVVGAFCESFSNKGFFDSLVGRAKEKHSISLVKSERFIGSISLGCMGMSDRLPKEMRCVATFQKFA
jgi:hypothetical protein